MTIIEKTPKPEFLDEIESPFDGGSPLFEDMSSHSDIKGRAVRVELRRTRDPAAAIGAIPPEKRILEEGYIIGLVDESDLPMEGENFELKYHNWSGLTDYGTVVCWAVADLDFVDDCFYFTTHDGQWRLKVLDEGN